METLPFRSLHCNSIAVALASAHPDLNILPSLERILTRWCQIKQARCREHSCRLPICRQRPSPGPRSSKSWRAPPRYCWRDLRHWRWKIVTHWWYTRRCRSANPENLSVRSSTRGVWKPTNKMKAHLFWTRVTHLGWGFVNGYVNGTPYERIIIARGVWLNKSCMLII